MLVDVRAEMYVVRSESTIVETYETDVKLDDRGRLVAVVPEGITLHAGDSVLVDYTPELAPARP